MKVAVLSDIHGNYIALTEVVNEIKKMNIKNIYVLGDMVGYYYHPDKVFDLLSNFKVHFVKGNHEKMLIESLFDENYLKFIDDQYGYGIRFAIDKLSKPQIEDIKEMPEQIIETFLDKKVVFRHAMLDGNNKYLYPDAEISVLNHYVQDEIGFIFSGHTHYPFLFSKNNTTIINVGSVGQARDKGGFASWCTFNLKNEVIVFHHTAYRIESIVREVKKINKDIPYLYEVLERWNEYFRKFQREKRKILRNEKKA